MNIKTVLTVASAVVITAVVAYKAGVRQGEFNLASVLEKTDTHFMNEHLKDKSPAN